MGQAKRRGSYEQRKADGEARREDEEQRRREEVVAREAAITPEQRAMTRHALMPLTFMLGLAVQSMERKLNFARATRSLAKPSNERS